MNESKFKVGDVVIRKSFGGGKIVAITDKPFLSYLVYFPGSHSEAWQALWCEEYELENGGELDVVPKISLGEVLARICDRKHSNVKPTKPVEERKELNTAVERAKELIDKSKIHKRPRAANSFVDYVCNKLDEVKELFRRKNQQYSVGADPLANFRTGALLRAGNDSYAEMYEEAKDYQRKHVVHIERNGIDADKGDESLDDIIVYSAIMAYMRHCYEQEQSTD